jgi:hypothetical protein
MSGRSIRFAGRTFASRRSLAAHLAVVTGRSVDACTSALHRWQDDPARVLDNYRCADAAPPTVFRFDSMTFDELERVQEAALETLADVALPPPPALPAPRLQGEPPAPLFTTEDDYETATLKLKAHRALYPDADDD